jgi:MOSC domain-containing protein YiiM
MGLIEAVCVVHEVRPDEGTVGRTAIDKRPSSGPVEVGPAGLLGDTQCDTRHHGGRDQAVYAYAEQDAAWWADQLGRGLSPGSFGENLRVAGIDVSGAVIGERWRIGGPDGVLLEVTAARIPCATFQRFLGEPRWVKRFTEHGAPGSYLRVLRDGVLAAGDPVDVEHRPEHGVTVRDTMHRLTSDTAGRLLEAGRSGAVDLHPVLRQTAEAVLARG